MRYKIKVEDQWLEVDIENLRTRPIIARVEGETFEVWPATELRSQSTTATAPVRAPATTETSGSPASSQPGPMPASAPGADGTQAVRAPIPGVIVSIAVQPGDEVTAGQAVCVLEAMKMNNTIRAVRAGRIARVSVSVGQHVKHHEVLMEFAE